MDGGLCCLLDSQLMPPVEEGIGESEEVGGAHHSGHGHLAKAFKDEGESARILQGPSMGEVGFSIVRRRGVCSTPSTLVSKSTGGS